MKKDQSFFDQFENLPSLEPSPEWNEKLIARVHQAHSARVSGVKGWWIAVTLLVLVNAIYISRNAVGNARQNNSLKGIASEILIATSSSAY